MHLGENDGYASTMVAYPKRGQAVAAMTNIDAGEFLREEILNRSPEEYGWLQSYTALSVGLAVLLILAVVVIVRCRRRGDAVTRSLKVATVAMPCDGDPEANWARIVGKAGAVFTAHPGVELLVFGEMLLGHFNPGGDPEGFRAMARPLTEETLAPLTALAREHSAYITVGLPERDGDTLHNAQVLLNPQGEIQVIHRKWNLKPGEAAAGYQPGARPVTVTDINGVRTGIIICSDAADPRVMWELMRSRLDLIVQSLADDRDEGWFVATFNARMYDAWFVTANRFGDQGGWYWNGHLVISDPIGRLQATSLDQEQVLVHELTFAEDRCRLQRWLRVLWVRIPLVWHVLRNWKLAKSYL